jgi:diguanylate cyclase (GGDEF)-like protein
MQQSVLRPAAAVGRAERRPLPARAQFLILGLLCGTALLLGTSLLFPHHARQGFWTFVLLLFFVVAADRIELYTGRSHDLRVATTPMIAAALLLPAPLVMVCGLGFATHRWGRPLLWRQRIFNGCNHAVGGLAAWAVVIGLHLHDERLGAGLAIAGVCASLIYALCTWALLISILHLTHDLSVAEMRAELPAVLSAEVGLGALGIVVAALWRSQPVLVPFAILPLILIWTSLKVSELRHDASVDVKTGLSNARHVREALTSELERAARYQRPLSVLVADLDFLRNVNNTYGHLAGDAVLAGIGDVLRRELRTTDIPARFGGEEFVVVLPETSQPRALQLAERVRRAVAEREYDFGDDGEAVHVTISIGVAAFPADAATEDELLRAADAAVYDAKARGRDRVVAAADLAVAV